MPSFNEEIKAYTEPCGGVGLERNPPDGSTDNMLLFSATAIELAKALKEPARQAQFELLAMRCEASPGCFRRKVDRSSEITNWDDHVGASCASPFLAKRVLGHGRRNYWLWGEEFLARIVDFVPAIKAAADEPLSLIDQVLACIGLIANLFEEREETSGKCLLYLKCRVYDRHRGKYRLLDACVKLWRWRMTRLYGDLAGLYLIYFKAHHPLTWHARGLPF